MQVAANWLNREFPDHEHSKRAMFLVGKMRMRGASPDERLKALKNIPPGDPNFSSARQEICAVFYEKWHAASEELKGVTAKELQQAITETLSPDLLPRIAVADQLALRLMAIDVAMSASPPDQATATKQLSAASSLVKRTGISPEMIAEYRYRSMQVTPGDSSEEHLSWFLEHGRGSRFEAAALISAAKALDSRRLDQVNAQSNKLGMRVYGRLSEILGSDPEKLMANRNAQVALSRSAHYAYQLGERKVAAAALDKLLAAFPKDRGYLRRAGLAHFELKQFKIALEQWKTIVAGSRAGTEPWFEAKYYQIACLLEVDRDAAASVFDQLKFLYPNLGPPAWRERFMGLEKRL
jgi:tetratricopeptide (TPR) repeat protein